MNESIIEAMAWAICDADNGAPESDAPIMLGMRSAKAWEARMPMARAVLTTALDHMQKLSGATKEAGRKEMPVEVEYWQEGNMLHAKPKELYNCVQPETVFQAMIDQLRKEMLDD